MDGPVSPGFDYPALMRSALLGVVRDVLARAAEHGLSGDHHFLLTFGTTEQGVELSADLLRRFPDEMTIVLQHQFWNLTVDEAGFGVTVRFAGKPERLFVPWTALHTFGDPSVDFGFRLQPRREEAPAEATAAPAAEPEAPASEPAQEPAARPAERTTERGEGNVIDFGAFRRRSDN